MLQSLNSVYYYLANSLKMMTKTKMAMALSAKRHNTKGI